MSMFAKDASMIEFYENEHLYIKKIWDDRIFRDVVKDYPNASSYQRFKLYYKRVAVRERMEEIKLFRDTFPSITDDIIFKSMDLGVDVKEFKFIRKQNPDISWEECLYLFSKK